MGKCREYSLFVQEELVGTSGCPGAAGQGYGQVLVAPAMTRNQTETCPAHTQLCSTPTVSSPFLLSSLLTRLSSLPGSLALLHA